MNRKMFCGLLLCWGLILGIRDGNIVLMRPGQSDPVRVFPYQAESLPLKDQEFLRKGIIISNERELSELLQDYLS